MTQLRCAVYARYSTDRQSPASIVDQVRKCREYAVARGWEVLDAHVYADEAMSGASTNRASLQTLLAEAINPTHPFDCILIDDSSRLTRKLADALNLYERLAFAGIRVVAVSQGVDTDSPQAELLIGVHGLIDAVYWRELAQKTHRGMTGLAIRGLHTGGRCFGYRSVKDSEGGAHLEINENEAIVVRRIFRLYADSRLSLKKVAYRLNEEHVPSPQPQKGRFSRSWCVSSVRHILLNQKYAGHILWNTRRKVRTPGTGKRVFRARPESEWVRLDAPHLRIIDAELFARVAAQFGTVKRVFSRNGNDGLGIGPKKYLFSGLLKCGECGGSVVLVCGRGRNGADRYGCSLHSQRGESVCRNGLLVRRDELEASLCRGLSESVLRPEAVEYALAKFEEALRQKHATLETDMANLRGRKRVAELEIERLVSAIAAGHASQSIMTAIAQREIELREILNELTEPGKNSIPDQVSRLREFAMERLSKLRELVSHPESVDQFRAVLGEHFGTFTLEVVEEQGTRSYRARGTVDWFGGSSVARTGGAGGQNRTGYARLFRAALYH
jgi:site-specific DNA recombinase